jgi:hypothetical protein
MARYAQRTRVPVDRSRAEIERLLEQHGATSFVYGSRAGQALLSFEMRDRRLRFLVPLPADSGNTARETERARREIRRRYRALLLVLKAKLEAVASKIVTFDEEFLAHIVLEGSSTVGDWIIPDIPQALKSGRLPPLLGAGEAK